MTLLFRASSVGRACAGVAVLPTPLPLGLRSIGKPEELFGGLLRGLGNRVWSPERAGPFPAV